MITYPLRALALASLALVAAAWPWHPARANPSVVVDVDTGEVLEADEATRPWIPASTTKMMTVYLALKAIKEGRASLDSPLRVSALAARQKPVKMYLKPGQIITLDNALKIMLVKSANDLAYVIAEGIGGSVPAFADMMNAEARTLGMHESHFVNPNGWDAPGHQSSARDLAILARAILRDFPQYAGYFDLGAVALGNKVFKNTNGLLGRYPGAMGMKTGFVCASGFNVVALAQRNGRRLLAVVLGSMSGADRTVKAAQLLDEGFSGASPNLGTLDMLPASPERTPPNICDAIRHRGAPLSDDTEADAGGNPAQEAAAHDSANPAYAMILQRSVATTRAAMTTHTPSGRTVLIPRAEFEPVPVFLGAKPGTDLPVLAARDDTPKALALPAQALPAGAMALTGPESQTAPRGTGAPLSLTGARVPAATVHHPAPHHRAAKVVRKAAPHASKAAHHAPAKAPAGKAMHGKVMHGKAARAKAAGTKAVHGKTAHGKVAPVKKKTAKQ